MEFLKQQFALVKDDWLKFGIMLTVSQFLSGGDFDSVWLTSVVYTLLGLAVFNLVIGKILVKLGMTSVLITDVTKYVTMTIVARWLTGWGFSQYFLSGMLFSVIGIAVYDLVISKFIDTFKFGRFKNIADDWFKQGTILLTSRLLAGGSVTSVVWLKSILYTLIGFTVYDLAIPYVGGFI